MYVLADNRTDQKPNVSIMMPCYNHGKYVADAIECILNQTYQDYEFIVLENGSLDNSREVILRYRDTIDLIVGVDVNSHFNVSLLGEYCRGDYIAVMYSDDYWEPEKLEQQMAAIKKYNVDFCFTQALYTLEDLDTEIIGSRNFFGVSNRKREKWIRRFFEYGNCLSNPSLVYARQHMEMVMETVPYKQLSDYDRWLHALLISDIYVVPEPLVRMRRHSQCVSVQTSETAARTTNEKSYIDLVILEAMPGELFAGAYEDVFPVKWENEDDLLAQKILVALGYAETDIGWHNIALTMFYKYYNIGDVKNILEKKYGFSFDELHEMLGKMGAGAWHFEKEELEKKAYKKSGNLQENTIEAIKKMLTLYQKWKALLEDVLKLEESGTVDGRYRQMVMDYLTNILRSLFRLKDEGVHLGNVRELNRLGEIFRSIEERTLTEEFWKIILECAEILESITERIAVTESL